MRERSLKIRLLVVGGGSPGTKIHRMIQRHGLQDFVRQTGWVSDATYRDMIRLSDVVVDLREISAAESPSSLLRAIALERPAIVSDGGTFSELPDSCCIKIPRGDDEQPALDGAIARFVEAPELVREMEQAARRYTAASLRMEQTADGYVEFLTEVARTTPASDEPVPLLESGRPKGSVAAKLVYRACRAGFLLRSYGVTDTARRMRQVLARHLSPEAGETL